MEKKEGEFGTSCEIRSDPLACTRSYKIQKLAESASLGRKNVVSMKRAMPLSPPPVRSTTDTRADG